MRRIGACWFAFMAVLSAGCIAEDLTLIVFQNQQAEEGCVIPSGVEAAFLSTGLLDLSGERGYVVSPVLQNGASVDEISPNQNVVLVSGADVELRVASTARSIEVVTMLAAMQQHLRTHYFSASIVGGGSAGVAFPAIDVDQVRVLRDLLGDESVPLVARIEVFGVIDGSRDVRTPPFDYPITVCEGCLVEDLGACNAIELEVVIKQGGACNIFQDQPVSCCDNGDMRVCPAPPPAMM